jgi:hypothetical protein
MKVKQDVDILFRSLTVNKVVKDRQLPSQCRLHSVA